VRRGGAQNCDGFAPNVIPAAFRMAAPPQDQTGSFIQRWQSSGAAERANYQLFLSELCDVLGVARPEPTRPDDEENAYVFERAVTFQNPDGSNSPGRIDLYRRACFVLEAKQGSDPEFQIANVKLQMGRGRRRRGTAVRGTAGWDDAMLAARGQAEQYAKALPSSEGWPPFVIVVDVGHSMELYSDFSRSGKTYIPFPDPRSHRILLPALEEEAVRERLRQIWTDPLALDPARRSARVTREVANHLAVLARSLEESGHAPEETAQFLMRCIFTMFAEDVRLLPAGAFTELLQHVRRDGVELFPELVQSLWRTMDTGGISPVLRSKVLQFNGGLFEQTHALPLTRDQLDLLMLASVSDWRDVEPAIFGTLLERALDPIERHKLGAHYTPRAYVERLVMPTVIEPLREEWATVQAAALTADREGNRAGAAEILKKFHRDLCSVRVLDPACGSGNFLYVTLEHLKRLEGEVLNALDALGQLSLDYDRSGLAVDPHQLLGIEVNPRAAAITDLVLWIGYLQWHFRTRGDALPQEPVIRKFRNIECRDAVLAYDGTEPLLDADGNPVTRWDGRTYKKHPVTGKDVPDDTARVPVLRYLNPRKAEWPEADYVVGNPPFIGGWKMRQALGDGYVSALWAQYPDIPEKADYVMYWWDRAAELVRAGELSRFGFITTNSVTQIFQRRVLAKHLGAPQAPLRLRFAIADHPWVDSETAADVRVAMTVGQRDEAGGASHLGMAHSQSGDEDEVTLEVMRVDSLNAALRPGVNLDAGYPLAANRGLCSPGVQLYGAGFIISADELPSLSNPMNDGVLRPYLNGRDLMGNSRGARVIDFFGLSREQASTLYPELFQRVLDRVKPEREHNRRESIREVWWRFGWERPLWRNAVAGLKRFIATPETAKHRVFVFLDASILPDNMLTNIALDEGNDLAVLSSRIHVTWALAAGGRLGVGNDPRYNKTRCFEPFPFPESSEEQKIRIGGLGETLDAHRKRQQALHSKLTITDMYNALEKLRSGEALTEKEKTIHEQGLVSVLKQIHDELDAAVFDAYGWPATLTDEEILERLVALNAERAAEERRGIVRWLRPEFQNPQAAGQTALDTGEEAAAVVPTGPKEKLPWPKALADQAKAVRAALASQSSVVSAEELARSFKGARLDRVEALLATLASLGQAREVEAGRFAV